MPIIYISPLYQITKSLTATKATFRPNEFHSLDRSAVRTMTSSHFQFKTTQQTGDKGQTLHKGPI